MAVVLQQNQFYRIGSCWQNKFSMSPKSNLGVFCVVFSFFLATNDQMLFFPHTLFTGNLFQLNVFIFCFGFGVSNCGKLIGCAGAGGGGARFCFVFVVVLGAFPGALVGDRRDFDPLPLLAVPALFGADDPVTAPVVPSPVARVDAGIVLHAHGIVHQTARCV